MVINKVQEGSNFQNAKKVQQKKYDAVQQVKGVQNLSPPDKVSTGYKPSNSINTVNNINAIQSDYLSTIERSKILTGVEQDLTGMLNGLNDNTAQQEAQQLHDIITKVESLRSDVDNSIIDKEKIMQDMLLPLENINIESSQSGDVDQATSLINQTVSQITGNPEVAALVQSNLSNSNIASILVSI